VTGPEAPAAPLDRVEGSAAMLHVGVAEQGKLHALDGDHENALAYYRVAMEMAVRAAHPEIFFRHYLECMLESLEHVGSYPEILDYCEKALALLESESNRDNVTPHELAHVHLRRGVVLLKSGTPTGARDALAAAAALFGGKGPGATLALTLIGWIDHGYRIETNRVIAEQRRARYFSVRPDAVDRRRAVVLPPELLRRGAAAR
jgi:hypothetical protein